MTLLPDGFHLVRKIAPLQIRRGACVRRKKTPQSQNKKGVGGGGPDSIRILQGVG